MFERFYISLGKGIGGQMQKGSTVGAIAGAVVGAVVGSGVLLLFCWVSDGGRHMMAPAIWVGVILGSICGGLVGAKVGPKGASVKGVGETGAIRITNLNRALLPLGFMFIPLVFIGLVFITPNSSPKPKTPEDADALRLMIAIVFVGELVGLAFLMTNLLWVDLRRNAVVTCRMLRRREFPIGRIMAMKLDSTDDGAGILRIDVDARRPISIPVRVEMMDAVVMWMESMADEGLSE